MTLIIVPSVIQSTIIPLIYIIDNIDQVRICVTVIILKQMNKLLFLVELVANTPFFTNNPFFTLAPKIV